MLFEDVYREHAGSCRVERYSTAAVVLVHCTVSV